MMKPIEKFLQHFFSDERISNLIRLITRVEAQIMRLKRVDRIILYMASTSLCVPQYVKKSSQITSECVTGQSSCNMKSRHCKVPRYKET
jgi:hypothetical protein